MTSHVEIKELFETVEKDADLMNFFPSAPNSHFSTPAPGTDELVHKKLVHAVVGDDTPTPKQVAELAAFKSLQEEMSEKPQPFTILFPLEEQVRDKGKVNFEMICDIARSLNSYPRLNKSPPAENATSWPIAPTSPVSSSINVR